MTQKTEDLWVPTLCYGCYSSCGIKVRRVDGLVVDIRPDPDTPHNLGKMCAKGKAGIMSLYDPYRLRAPLKRTNPQKGFGKDPGWQEMSWEEALSLIAQRVKEAQQRDPRRILTAGIDFQLVYMSACFGAAHGAPTNWFGSSSYYCGNGLHPVTYLTTGAFYAEPDFDHCRFCLLIGTQLGFLVNTNATPLAVRMAEARARGMKLVVVDPVCTQAGSKADRWIPIRPGTDGALALGMLNLLLNHLAMYDKEFLKRYTNAPYLVGPDGHYIREPQSHRPLIWDTLDDKPKPYDDPSLVDPALEGEFLVDGQAASSAFALLKEHVKQYPVEMVSQATTIPEETILELASELAQSARIGSTIVIDGHELPLRPVAAVWCRGAIAHKNALATGFAIQLLNMVLGAIDVPGGILGTNPVGPFWAPKEGPDGLLVPSEIQMVADGIYPARRVSRPQTATAKELFPVSHSVGPLAPHAMVHPEKFGLPYPGPEVLIRTHSNLVFSGAQPPLMAEALAKTPFVVSFCTHLDETAELCDILLPDAHYLERLSPFPNRPNEHLVPGEGVWYWTVGQPVVEPAGQARCWAEVLLELAYRTGQGADFLVVFGAPRKLSLDPKKEYSWEEIVDHWAQSWFGPDHNLDWFKKHSLLVTRKKKIEEAYPRPFLKQRIPIYLEHFINAGQEVAQLIQELGLPWDSSSYQPLPDWVPCPAYHDTAGQRPFYVVNYKLPFHTFSVTPQNPWLDELSQAHSWAYRILMNRRAASRCGIQDGDYVWLESVAGRVKGQVRLTECIHPEVLAVAGTFGHWAEGMPIALGKGVHFNRLVPNELERIDPVSGALDACIRVKVVKC